MKIEETKRYVWTDTGCKEVKPSRRNIDGQEIAKWMKELAMDTTIGLLELPRFKSKAIARYMDTKTLKDGNLVAIYAVQEGGLYRDWVYVNTKYFGNTGRCTTLAALSKENIVESMMRYKKGKEVSRAGAAAIRKFYDMYINMVEFGTSGRDFIKRVLEKELDIKLPENYSFEDLNTICKEIVENGGEYEYPSEDQDDYMGIPRNPVYYETF